MRKLLLSTFAVLLGLLAAPTASAELQLQVDDFEIVPGNTAWKFANLYAEHDNYFSAIQIHFALIDGITFSAASPVISEMTQPYQEDDFGEAITWSPMYNTDLAANEFKIILKFDQNNSDGFIAYFPPGRTLLCRIAVKADESFTGATLHLNYAKTDYSDPTPGAPTPNTAEVFHTDLCQITVPATVTTSPLATIVAEGVDGTEYTVEDALAVVAKGDNCVFVTDGQDNWIKVAAQDEVFDAIAAMDYIEAGTLVGTLSEADCNQTLTVTEAPTEGTNEVPYEIASWDMMDGMLPKTNSVISLTGYWSEAEGAFGNYDNSMSVTANFAWCENEPDMIDGAHYIDVVSIVQQKAPWDNGSKVSADDELAYQNLVVYPTIITEDNVHVGVENLKGDQNVVSVQYVNVAGQVATTPFEGVNMVVTRYADGSTKTTKVIK